jgi:hypothetical protein
MSEPAKETAVLLMHVPYERFAALEAAVAALTDAIPALTAGMETLLNKNQTIDLEGIAARQGVSLTKVKQQPWRQPNFGQHEGRRLRWMRETYLEWEKDLEKHRMEWDGMPISQRCVCVGIARPEKKRGKTA